MCSRCNAIEAVADRNKHLSRRIDEVSPGNFVHGLSVDECPNCGRGIYAGLEAFLIDGCSNCGYTPEIRFVTDDETAGGDSRKDAGDAQ